MSDKEVTKMVFDAVDFKIHVLNKRIAALEAENAALRELVEAATSNRLDGIWCADIHIDNRFVNWFDRRRQLLTPEGGSNGN